MKISGLFFISFFFAFSAISQTLPRWTPETLYGKVSQHDGPNCYNGALASAGYVDELVQVDSSEYRFYLEFFCKKNTVPSNQGIQLLAFEYGDQGLEHAALALDSGKIFEKTSIAGLQGRYIYERDEASVYSIKKLSDSRYYLESLEPESKIRIESYSCEAPSIVRSQVERISQNEVVKLVRKLKQRLEVEVTFQVVLSDLTSYNQDLNQLASALNGLSTGSVEEIYSLTLATSILSYIYNLTSEISISDEGIDASVIAARTNLTEAIGRAFEKHKAQQLTDTRLLKVLEEIR